jgi:hypothetical protein
MEPNIVNSKLHDGGEPSGKSEEQSNIMHCAPGEVSPRSGPVLSAWHVYRQSDGAVTRAFYEQLKTKGPIGEIAINLFRAQKASHRAKKYRGGIRGKGSYRSMAYDRKGWSLQNLAKSLVEHGKALSIAFGWGYDDKAYDNKHVLYVDLPPGQVSFHSPERYEGPDYPHGWDHARLSDARICKFCDSLFGNADSEPITPPTASPDLKYSELRFIQAVED